MRPEDRELELAIEHHRLVDNGLLDPGQSTEYAHILYQRRLNAPFSVEERRLIRVALGLAGDVQEAEKP